MEKPAAYNKEIPGAFAILFVLFIIALFFDAFATSLFMLHNGWQFEIHPIVRWGAAAWGPIYGPVFGAVIKILGGLFLAFLHRRASCYVLLLTAVISILAGFYNIIAYTFTMNSFLPHL